MEALMTNHIRINRCSRTGGRAAIFLALSVAVLLSFFAILTVFFLLDRPRENLNVRQELTDNTDDTVEQAASKAAEAVVKTADEITRQPSDASPEVVAPDKPSVRIHGTVKSEDQKPLPGAWVRWLPASSNLVRSVVQDVRIFGENPELERINNSTLLKAFQRSQVVTTDEAGAYEFSIDANDDLGLLIAIGPGHAVEYRRIQDQPTLARKATDEPHSVETPITTLSLPKEYAINFVLSTACSISGTVTDKESGDPAAGMYVAAGSFDADKLQMMNFVKFDAPRATVGEDGTFQLGGLKPGDYRIVARTGDSNYSSIPSRDGPRVTLEAGVDITDVDLQVTLGGLLRCIVVDAKMNPIQGAKGHLLPKNFMERSVQGDIEAVTAMSQITGTTDGDGVFDQGGLPLDEDILVAVKAKGFAPTSSEPVKLTQEKPEQEVTIVVTEGFSIAGFVTYENGAPAANVKVGLVMDFTKIFSGEFNPSSLSNDTTHTSENGAFAIHNLARGEYQVKAGGPRERVQIPFSGGDGVKVVIDGTGDVTDVQIILPSPGDIRVAGWVRDNTGAPIKGASITIASATQMMIPGIVKASAKTDSEGRFVAENLKDGPFKIHVKKSGYVTEKLDDIEPDTLDVVVMLKKLARISGYVVTTAGDAPGVDGSVKVVPVEDDASAAMFQQLAAMQGNRTSDDIKVQKDGTFTIEASPGKVRVHVSLTGFAPAKSELINIGPGDELEGVEVIVSVGGMLHGKVIVAGRAEGLKGARVTITPVSNDVNQDFLAAMMPQFFGNARNSATTDAEGLWEISHLVAGKYSVTASHEDYAPSEPHTINLAEEDVKQVPVLIVTVGGIISGVVTENDEPKKGVMVQLIGSGVPMKQKMNEPDGSFRFEGLKSGEYMLQIMDMATMAKGGMSMKQRHITVVSGEELVSDIAFGTGVKIYGKVKGMPPGPMRILQLRREGGPLPETIKPGDIPAAIEASKFQAGIGTITPDNTYSISGIEPGEYVLEIPRMPSDPTDIAAYEKMDLTPRYRAKIKVEKKDIEHNINLEK